MTSRHLKLIMINVGLEALFTAVSSVFMCHKSLTATVAYTRVYVRHGRCRSSPVVITDATVVQVLHVRLRTQEIFLIGCHVNEIIMNVLNSSQKVLTFKLSVTLSDINHFQHFCTTANKIFHVTFLLLFFTFAINL